MGSKISNGAFTMLEVFVGINAGGEHFFGLGFVTEPVLALSSIQTFEVALRCGSCMKLTMGTMRSGLTQTFLSIRILIALSAVHTEVDSFIATVNDSGIFTVFSKPFFLRDRVNSLATVTNIEVVSRSFLIKFVDTHSSMEAMMIFLYT